MVETVLAEVEEVSPLTNSILKVILKPTHYIPYRAGQYLQVFLEKEGYSFSIANAPLGARFYELHIRHSQENQSTQKILNEIKKRGKIKIKLPLGECHLDQLEAGRPILFIAGGTGFAPIKAMIEQLLASGDKRSFELFWGAHSQSDLYMDEKVRQWQAHVECFRYFSLLSYSNKQTLVSRILNYHKEDLHLWQVIMAGPFEMVYAIQDAFLAQNIPRSQMFSDAFNFERGN